MPKKSKPKDLVLKKVEEGSLIETGSHGATGAQGPQDLVDSRGPQGPKGSQGPQVLASGQGIQATDFPIDIEKRRKEFASIVEQKHKRKVDEGGLIEPRLMWGVTGVTGFVGSGWVGATGPMRPPAQIPFIGEVESLCTACQLLFHDRSRRRVRLRIGELCLACQPDVM